MPNSFESFSVQSAESKEDVEQEVDELLGSLPEEIAGRWEDAHRHLSSDERRVAISEFVEKRRKALRERVGSGSDPEHVAVVEKSPLAILNMIEHIEQGPHEKLGQGEAGHVIASIRYPNVCYKVMFPLDRIPKGTNDISVEADLQDEVAQLGEIHGVRTPKVFSFVHEGATRAITMERLNAVSMRDVLDGKEKVPPTFRAASFMDRLEKYIYELNARGYYHRDLHEGNVMIDKESGTPYVIDFGYSKFSPLPDDAYELKVIESGHSVDIVLRSDVASLERLRVHAELLDQGGTA